MDHALEVLGAVESLLLLEQVDVADERDATNVLAVRTVCEISTVSEVGALTLLTSPAEGCLRY